jgi:3-phytase
MRSSRCLLVLLGAASAQQPEVGCVQPVQPLHQTDSLNDPDDPAIWLSPESPGASLIIGTDKGTENDADGSRMNAAVVAFRTTGELVQRIPLLRPNNVDVEYGLSVQGVSTDIAVTCERNRAAIRVYSISGGSAAPLKAIDNGGIDAFATEPEEDRACMGVGVFKRPGDGAIFALFSRKSGPSSAYIWQYRIQDADGDGVVEVEFARAFGLFSGDGEIEAVAVDDAAGVVYYADEGCCVRSYLADPDTPGAADPLLTFGHDGFAKDREGISVYMPPQSQSDAGGAGFLIISDQQRNGTFRMFCRDSPHEFVGAVQIAGTDGSDGSEVISTSLGPGLESGAFVAMSDIGHQFSIFPWSSIAACLPADACGSTAGQATSFERPEQDAGAHSVS